MKKLHGVGGLWFLCEGSNDYPKYILTVSQCPLSFTSRWVAE